MTHQGLGDDLAHTAIDDHSRPAHAGIHDDGTAGTCAEFPTRAAACCADHGLTGIGGLCPNERIDGAAGRCG